MKKYSKEHMISIMPNYIRQSSKYLKIRKNDFLYHKSEEFKYVYYVVVGSFSVVNEFESGKLYEPVILPNEDFIGVVEVIHGMKEIISTIIANEDAEVFQFDREKFSQWMRESHELTNWVLYAVSRNFIQNMKMSGENVILDSRYILIKHIVGYAKHNDGIFTLDESREKTSVRTGVNIRTLYRHLNELKDQGLITTQGRKIIFQKEQHNQLIDYVNQLRNK